MRADQDWTRIVFRLRQLPNSICSPTEAASLLAGVLGLPAHHVVVYSVATTLDKWEVLPSKVATLQLKSVPARLQNANDDEDEWRIVMAEQAPGHVLILDIHFKGLTPLNDVEPARHFVDCIAISGLASHPFGSWQPRGSDKSFMWIRDSLPAAIPGLRALVYGYDSSLVGSSSFKSIADIAQSLVLHLKSGGWNLASSKPLVFLAHSLGGLVLKRATVQAASGDRSIASILDNILGAIMFGVPSLGMQQSHLMAMVEGQPNELLVQDLSREGGGNYVRQLHTQFEGLSFLRKARILWAYETKESSTVTQRPDGMWDRNGPPTVLVNPESATSRNYRTNQSSTIPIDEDHSNMVKFPPGDATLGVVIHSLRELCSSSPAASISLRTGDDFGDRLISSGSSRDMPRDGRHTEDSRDERMLGKLSQLVTSLTDLHDELHAPELGLRIDQVDDPFESTFAWVFDVPSFCRWLQDPGSKLFWIHGKPGSGKSTLMKFIFESQRTWEILHNWRTGSLEVKAGFFFHHRGSALQKSFEGVLRSLVTQILAAYYEPYRIKHEPTLKKYRRLQQAREKLQRESDGTRKRLMSSLEAVSTEISALRVIDRVSDGLLPTAGAIHDEEQSRTTDTMHDRKLSKLLDRRAKITERLSNAEREHEYKLSSIRASVAALAAQFQPHSDDPVAKFLARVAGGFGEGRGGMIPKLERALSQLLDQDVQKTDLVLFFDALDEFDGHLDLICRFLKGLVICPQSSLTTVKICFSSRPWEPLKEHFSAFPGFSLQNYTKSDMEEFAARSVAKAQITDPRVMRLVPDIIARANGVFLWVKLALKVLFDTAATTPTATLPGVLEKKLNELPDDLFEFYKLIISRISRNNRRHTFALLELLARRLGSQNTVIQIWSATIIASCSTYRQAEDELNRAYPGQFRRQVAPPLVLLPTKPSDEGEQARKDIAAWSGGLVEVKRDHDADYLELMHQTVLEFATSLECKRIVLGDLASFIYENGHSFYLKYLILCQAWEPIDFWDLVETRKKQYRIGRRNGVAGVNLVSEVVKHIAHHAEASELTTGMSHFDFIYDVCSNISYNGGTKLSWSKDDVFLSVAASCGLTLCLRDWLGRPASSEPGVEAPEQGLPLLQALVFRPSTTPFAERHLTTIRLILEKGYLVNQEPEFLAWLYREDWESRSHHRDRVIPDSTLFELTKLVLEHGADPNFEIISLFSSGGMIISPARPLHIAPPRLASELIRHGANSDPSSNGRGTALDWVVNPEAYGLRYLDNLDAAERYERCQILVKAGEVLSRSTSVDAWALMLNEFDSMGYDTQNLWGLQWSLPPDSPSARQKPPGQHPPDPGPRAARPWSGADSSQGTGQARTSQDQRRGIFEPTDGGDEPHNHSAASSTRRVGFSRRNVRGVWEAIFRPPSPKPAPPKVGGRFQRPKKGG